MVRHVIVWTLKDEYSEEEKAEIKAGIKAGLEGLTGKIPGLIEIKVAMLDSLFESEEALKGYSSNPLHVEVANTKVRPFVKVRSSFDYLV